MTRATVGLFTQLPTLEPLPPQIPSPPKKSEGTQPPFDSRCSGQDAGIRGTLRQKVR